MNRNKAAIAVMFAATIVLVGYVFSVAEQAAQPDDRGDAKATEKAGKDAPSLNAYDRHFLTDAASGGLMEVEAGKLAVAHGQSAEVKSFGEHMVSDHGKANLKLTELASQKGLELPKEMNAAHRAKLDNLKKLSGEEFDRAYVDNMVKDHEKTITNFEHELRQGNDEDVKAFAEETLPTLREHLGRIQKIDKEQDAAASARQD